jgi:hypothetical protein
MWHRGPGCLRLPCPACSLLHNGHIHEGTAPGGSLRAPAQRRLSPATEWHVGDNQFRLITASFDPLRLRAMGGLRNRIDTAVWTSWFRCRSRAPDRLVSMWGASRGAHLAARSALSAYELRNAQRLATDPNDLHHFEYSVHSQNGEDGIIAEIFQRVGHEHRVFVEIGASDGAENCTAHLASQGWSGIWIEGDHDKVAAARKRTVGHSVRVVERFIDRESILSVLDEASTPTEPDLLVIDVDGNDYWVWEAVATQYMPRVVVVEYNATVGPHLQWVMPYNPNHRWNKTAWHGAGLAALAGLGRSLGYVLVGCDSHGVNAFFVLRRDAWRFSAASVRDRWVPPRYVLPYGHPIRPFGKFDVRPLAIESDARIVLRVSAPRLTTVDPGQIFYLGVIVTNGTDQPIGFSGDNPFQLSYWWLGEDGHRLVEEPVRCHQLWRSGPNASCNLLCRASAPKEAGTYSLVLGLVQEGVRWLDEANVTAGKWNVRPRSSFSPDGAPIDSARGGTRRARRA